MAPLLHLLFLSFAASSSLTAAQSRISNVTVGSSLSTNTDPNFWSSPSGRFAFGFYPEQGGFKVGIWLTGIQTTTVVWTANRDALPVPDGATLTLTKDGIILQSQSQNTTTISDGSSGLPALASMLDSGNFVLYNSNSVIIWESFDSPTDTILGGQRLLAGNQLYSSINETDHSTGKFRLSMQTDGNLVLYPLHSADTRVFASWSSGTSRTGDNVTLNLNADGHLYLLNTNGSNISNFTQGNSSVEGAVIYRATLDVDGIFRLYSHSFGRNGSSNTSVIWNAMSDTCDVKGFCGFNSYCASMDTGFTCLCPPGFDYVNPGMKFDGCERNITEQDCRGNTENVTEAIVTLENTGWEDTPYELLSQVTGDECRQACMDDCNCQVARYEEGECSKQMLPLRYGRSDTTDLIRTFIKVGNQIFLNGSSSVNPTMVSEENKNKWPRIVLIVTIVLGSCSLVVFSVSAVLIYRYRLWNYSKISEQKRYVMKEDISLRLFSYRELENATDGFKEELGRGAFGAVFKGSLTDAERTIAVKRLENVSEEGDREFRAEVTAIGRTYHKNLVRLLGFCDEGSNRLLVYEFMSNGSLADLLFRSERRPDWNQREKIAVEIARGILYLHEECETQTIHCDIKPANILMDEFLTPKISDFGMAKLMQRDQTRSFTAIRGTKGYTAPEWYKNVPITAKVDVYSFGIVLLEMVCRRKSVELDGPDDQIVLSDWVYDCYEARQLDKLVSGEEVELERLEWVVKVGLWCVQEEPSLRPSMKEVILMLEGTIEIPVLPGPTSSVSTL